MKPYEEGRISSAFEGGKKRETSAKSVRACVVQIASVSGLSSVSIFGYDGEWQNAVWGLGMAMVCFVLLARCRAVCSSGCRRCVPRVSRAHEPVGSDRQGSAVALCARTPVPVDSPQQTAVWCRAGISYSM